MKKMLLTGGSHAEIPLIQAAKEIGWYVITTGTNPEGLGHKISDAYVYGDYSDLNGITEIAERSGVDAIVSGCNDFAYLSTAYACEKLKLPGHDAYETALLIHTKSEFRRLAHSLQIPAPAFTVIYSESELSHAVEELGFPLLIKPVDLTGGKGVRICRTLRGAREAYAEALRQTRQPFVIAEQLVEGSNHGCSMLLKNRKVVFSVFDDEQYYLNPYLVSGASMPPCDMSEDTTRKMGRYVEQIAQHLSLQDGLFHTQFIVRADGVPVMIDPCRRAPGDLYLKLTEYHSGVPIAREIVSAESGGGVSDRFFPSCRYIARECIMSASKGTVREINIDDRFKASIIDQCIWGAPGDVITDHLKYKAGIVFLEAKSQAALQSMVASFHDSVKVQTEE